MINSQIIDALKEMNININDGIVYLLGKKYGYVASHTPDSLIASVQRSGIISLDTFNSVQWNIPLFDGEEVSQWDWVKKEYRNIFKEVNPAKSGNGNDCVRRMKKLFAENPDVRKDEILGATKMYINNNDSDYIRFSHYFIEKGKGAEKTNDILTWVEKYRELSEQSQYEGRNQQMQ